MPLDVALGLAVGLLVLTPWWCWSIGQGWPHSLRDQAFLFAAVGVCLALLTTSGWPLGICLAVAIWHWVRYGSEPLNRPERGLAGVLTWLVIAAVWFLGRWIAPAHEVTLRWVITLSAWSQLGVLVWQVHRMRGPMRHMVQNYHQVRDNLRGSMGNRVMTGCYFAFALPLAPAWWAALPVVLGLLATSSSTALAAATLGLLVVYPAWWPWVALGSAGGFLVHLAIRGGLGDLLRGSMSNPFSDSLMDRLRVWVLTVGTWWHWGWRSESFWVGRGHHAFYGHARWWAAQQGTRQLFKHAHQDGVQMLLEYGAVGVGCALMIVSMAVWRAFGASPPMAGALLSMLVVSLMQFPFHTPHTGLPWILLAGWAGGT